jgi:hypothetical protein
MSMNRNEAIVWLLQHPKEILRREYINSVAMRRVDYWMFFNNRIVFSTKEAGTYKPSDAWLRQEHAHFLVHQIKLSTWSGSLQTVTDCAGPFLRLPRDFIGRRVRVTAAPVSTMSGKAAMIWMLKHTGYMVRAIGKSKYDEYMFSNSSQGFRGRNGGRARHYPVEPQSLLPQLFTISDTWKDTVVTTSDVHGPYVRLPPCYEDQEMRVHVSVEKESRTP